MLATYCPCVAWFDLEHQLCMSSEINTVHTWDWQVVIRTVISPVSSRPVRRIHGAVGLVWSLHVLPVFAWVFSGYSGFLPVLNIATALNHNDSSAKCQKVYSYWAFSQLCATTCHLSHCCHFLCCCCFCTMLPLCKGGSSQRRNSVVVGQG